MAFTPGKGTTISVTTSGSTTFVAISQVVSITPPPMEMGEVEVTHLGDTWRQFIPTILEGGIVTFGIEWDPAAATHVELLNGFTTGSTRSFRIGFTDTGTALCEFSAFVKSFPSEEITVDNVVVRNLTLRTTSAVTITT
jgi:hypothetical protein